ncbi:PH domain-containing protein [Bacillus badius]|uniref:Uncharacterized protein YyaB-like PH domain-containing protein n=1 Tax=Bacillus badius TaxID=1455 RepID=A0ABR5AX27_BACBA|nr:PH domain-containing protein [Bacillus badius]KIL79283.1 hypothetical protein SD77_3149 [Bacillus badius]KZR59768.1 hypothetical protein A3781_11980 [Bacillus badius]MED4716472.1 PH domain-containing protein [Bacillus badius]
MYFPSSKDWWLSILYWLLIGGCVSSLFIEEDHKVLIFTLPLAVWLAWSWFATGYYLCDDWLIIKNGPIKKKIFIKEIRKVTKTKNPLAAPALSINRLEIIYGADFELALISPKDQEQFVSVLKSIHPPIETALD